MAKDAKVLIQSMKRTGEGKRFYDYNPAAENHYSHSRSQYAVSACGGEPDGDRSSRDYWSIVEKGGSSIRYASGAWKLPFTQMIITRRRRA